jgi:CBS domain-containing protein
MIKLLQIHVQENVIDSETAGAMTGALTYKNIAVKDVMTPIDKTFMLSVDEKLSFETIARIFRTGYSRIPVFEVSRNNVIGLLFVKDLIFIDPEDDTPIRSFVQIFGRGVHVVWPDDKLGDVLAELKQGKSHLALVRDVNNEDETQDPFYELKGIITLEDIIEKILGDRIVDETDAFIDNAQRIKVMRGESFDWARLRLLDTKIVDEMLSFSEVRAVTAHLRMNYAGAVQLLTDIQLERLVTQTPVSNLPTASQDIGQPLPNELLYKKGVPNDTCTLILGGKVTILVGKENFRSDISSWTLLASSALTDPNYTPDFTAYVSDGPCRCLQFTHQAFLAAMDASAVERRLEVERKQAAAAIVSSQEQAAAPEAAASPETLAKDKKEASDHRNRREKLIAAMQMFKKDDDSSQEGDEGEPEVTTPKPKETSVRFQQGGGFLTNSSRNVSSQETPGTDSLASSNQLSSIEEQSSPPASPVKSSTNVIDEGKETEPKSGDSGEK